MAIWTCTSCGTSEPLSFVPDCCSYCRGAMETQSGRSTNDPDEFIDHALDYLVDLAEEGDPSAIVMLWQRGEQLSASMSAKLSELMLVNRVGLLGNVFRAEAA